ncbi:MAG: hypothetical protein J6T92_04530 [Ottowia sp.]|nr:hypothetical protein [Ottowia sp.]
MNFLVRPPAAPKTLDDLPEHFFQVQARRADGALAFNGFITAMSEADARRQAERKWPDCSIRIDGKERSLP